MDNQTPTCEEIEILLQDYLDGYLLDSQRRDLEAHLAGCPACRRELALMQRLEAQLGEHVDVDVPPDLDRLITGRLPVVRPRPWMSRVLVRGGVGLGLAVVLLTIGLAMWRTPRAATGRKTVELVFHDPAARAVAVAGDFNDWDTARDRMRRDSQGTWRVTLALNPGLYQYNFFVDNRQWAEDRGASPAVNDGFGGSNSLLYVEG